jgi:hypothetical protein
MDEFDLIEVSRRFRVMEDLLERADLILAGKQEHLKNRNPVEAERIEELRGDIDFATTKCRDDMTAMQEAIRAGRK